RDALAGELLRERLRECGDARLRGGVVRLTEVSDLTDHRGDVYDPAVVLLEHLIDEDLGAVENTVEIDGENFAPRRVIHLDERLVRVDARVVHEDVEVSELAQD